MPKKNHPEAPQLPFTYPANDRDNKPINKPNNLTPSAKERRAWEKERKRDTSFNDATYGKRKPKFKYSGLSGEVLRRGYAQTEEWRKKYAETREIPPQFNTDEEKEIFLKLIGWK